jgi:hypothetical protein
MSLAQLLPLIILFFLTFLSPSTNNSEPQFSFQPTDAYSVERLSAARNIKYYITRSAFETDFSRGNDARKVHKFEDSVEHHFVRIHQNKCSQEMQVQQRALTNARWFGTNEEVQKAQGMKLDSCEMLHTLDAKGRLP